MSLLMPAALGLLLLAIPITLLYLLRQRRRHVRVSSLMFWDQVLKEQYSITSRTRLRKWLSLLAQLLFLALVTLAIARPQFSGEAFQPRRYVIVVDASASMNAREEDGQTRFGMATERAKEFVRSMRAGDTALLAVLTDGIVVAAPLTESKQALLDAIETLEPSHTEGHLDSVRVLLEGLPAYAHETYAVLISDGAFDRDSPALADGLQERTVFALNPIGTRPDNAGITAIGARALPNAPREAEILLTVLNASDTPVSAPAEIYIDGILSDAREVALGPGEERTLVLRQLAGGGRVAEVRLDLDDALPDDNRAFALLPEYRPINVLLVTPGNLFLESALETDPLVSVFMASPRDHLVLAEGGYGTSGFDAAILDRAGEALEAPVPAENVWYIGQWPDDAPVVRAPMPGETLVTEWARTHPMLLGVNPEGILIEQGQALQFDPPVAPMLIALGSPVAALQASEARRTLYQSFDFTRSDWPLRTAFPIFVSQAVRFLADGNTAEDLSGFRPGQAWDATADAPPADASFVRQLPLEGGATPPEYEPVSGTPRFAGVYGFANTGENGDAVFEPVAAVNIASPRETRIAPARDPEALGAVPYASEQREGVLGGAPWFALAVCAGVLSLAEWAAYHRRWLE